MTPILPTPSFRRSDSDSTEQVIAFRRGPLGAVRVPEGARSRARPRTQPFVVLYEGEPADPDSLAAHTILDRNIAYAELGPDYFHRRHNQQQQTRRLVRQLERLGYSVTLQPAQAA